MAAAGTAKFLYFAYLAKPAADRVLYRAIRKYRPERILEVGMGSTLRTQRLIQVAQRYLPTAQIRFTGIDMFEGRDKSSPGVTLKHAHRTLPALGAAVQLVPGDPFSALARVSNSLRGVDMVIISADQQGESLAQAWFYVPRILHDGSRIFIEQAASGKKATTFVEMPRRELERLATEIAASRRRAA